MSIKLTSTHKQSEYVKILVFGDSGTGKTKLIGTAPKPLIISTESGLLSLADIDIPVITAKSLEDIYEIYEYINSPDGSEYETICLDSITDLAESMLTNNKAGTKDGRAAYGKLNDDIADVIRAFRDIENKHVYMTAKQARIEDSNTGICKYKPMLPGRTLTQQICYWFDEVLCLRIGEDDDGEQFRYLQSQPSITHEAKDRSGKLDDPELPDLAHIFNKVTLKSNKTKEN